MATQGLSNKRVLVIEDSHTQAMHLQALLETSGLHVLVASDGRSGLQTAREANPDLVVLDLEMPGMNGFQVCQELKTARETAGIPVIMLTRHDDGDTVVLGLQVGADEYIPKDAFSDAVLLETLRQMGVLAVE